MRNALKWRSILLFGLVLLLVGSVVAFAGCGKSSQATSVGIYLEESETIINEATDTAREVSNLIETADLYDKSEIVSKCASYGKVYDDLLLSFATLGYPQECLTYRKYVIDGLTYCKQEVTEFGAYFATGDVEHLYKAESYFNDTRKSMLLAADEWERLANIAEEEDGIGILEIFLGLLVFGVVVAIAMVVLQLTLGVGFGIIGGITVAIGSIIRKIKGGSKE